MNNYSIEKINNKSFNNYTYSDNNPKHALGNVNIFFGSNGAGKTALSQYFCQKFPETSRVFNSDYVRNNIYEKQGIQGSSIIIGNENINLQNEIDELRNKLRELEKKGKEESVQKDECISKIAKQMGEIVSEQKKVFSTRIQQKPRTKENPQKAFILWQNDANSDVRSTATSVEELDKEIEILTLRLRTPVQNILDINTKFIEQLEEKLHKTVIKPHGEINYQLIQWLKEGIELHKLTDNSRKLKCLFCGNDFNGSNTLEIIQKKINNDYSELMNSLQSSEGYIEKAKAQLSSYLKILGDKNAEYKINVIQSLIIVINKKRESPETEIAINSDEKKAISEIINEINELREEDDNKYQDLQKEKTNIEQVARKRTGELIVGSKLINEELEFLKDIETTLDNRRKDYSNKLNELKELENQGKDFTGFKDLINKQLRLAGVDFRLKTNDGNTNGLFDVIIENSSLNNNIENKQLSEGEIRLIAFLKFYYDLFSEINDNVVNLKENIDTIIFDDPITSVDINNRIFILDLINRLINKYINNSGVGVLIFTHSDYDFHNFAYSYKDARRFIVKKDESDHSIVCFIEKKELLNFSDTYKNAFQDIVSFAIKSKNNLSLYKNYYKYGNQARYVLETHARSNYELQYATEKGIKDLAVFYNITTDKKSAVDGMLNTINALSHGNSYIQGNFHKIEASEIQKAVRILILLLYKKDEQHVKCMSGSYWPPLKRAMKTWKYFES